MDIKYVEFAVSLGHAAIGIMTLSDLKILAENTGYALKLNDIECHRFITIVLNTFDIV
jgi:hypothetical protein